MTARPPQGDAPLLAWGEARHAHRQREIRRLRLGILGGAALVLLVATWLDRSLAGEEPVVARDAGFGREVRTALAARRQWLVEQGLADAEGDGVARLRRGVLAALQRRELLQVAGALREDLGKAFVELGQGQRIEGRLTRQVELASGRYALVERSREFTLVPWRPVLARQLGKPVAGIMRREGISWQFGRSRAGPQIP